MISSKARLLYYKGNGKGGGVFILYGSPQKGRTGNSDFDDARNIWNFFGQKMFSKFYLSSFRPIYPFIISFYYSVPNSSEIGQLYLCKAFQLL